MFALVGAMLMASAYDPDAIVTTARQGNGSVPVVTAPLETQSPSSTVSSAAHGLTTAQQINRWMDDRPAVEDAPVWRDQEPRRMTGEVSLGIGSGDYRHGSAHVTMPLGETGTLSLGYSQTKNGGWYGRPMGAEGLFWSPRDEWLGPQWVTPSGRSYSPLDRGPSLIDRREPERPRD